MNRRIAVPKTLMALVFCWLSASASADGIEYQFRGNLSGFTQAQLPNPSNPVGGMPAIQLTNVPFQVTIFGDTNNIGSGYSLVYNNGINATWDIIGIDTTSTSFSQVSTSTIGVIGFSWGGHTFAENLSDPLGQYLGYSGNFFPLRIPSFYSTVPQTPINLITSLTDTTRLPIYTTKILFPSIGSFALTGMSDVTYSVSPIPEPSEALLLCFGLLGLAGMARKRKSIYPKAKVGRAGCIELRYLLS